MFNNKNPVWWPLKGSQEFALDSRAHETLYHGTRGPGKTEIQLMMFKKYVGQGYGPFWRGVIFDVAYKNLDDIEIKSKKLFRKFNDGARYLSSSQDKKWVWPTGEELLFRAVAVEDDYYEYHGHEYPFIGWNELTKFKDDKLYDLMMSCNRSSFSEKDWPVNDKGEKVPVPPIPEIVFSTTNSKGPGRMWVKRRFIDVAPMGKLVKVTRMQYSPITEQEEPVTTTQVHIFGSWRENKFLSPKYIAQLTKACKDENTRRSWLEGDWNVVEGGAFNDIWKDQLHKLPRFKIPFSWYVNRTFDWGSSQPFIVGWWAESNGDEAIIEVGGKEYPFCPPKGSLIKLAEWYGTEEIGTNKGIRLSAGMIAEGIKEREQKLLERGWIAQIPSPGPADNQISNVREDDVDTIEKKMQDKGIYWMTSDKSPGSRVNGFDRFRERLENSIKYFANPDSLGKKDTCVFFMDNCLASLAIIPNLERDKKVLDDVDSEQEDHPWDETRYRILQGNNRWATDLNFNFVA